MVPVDRRDADGRGRLRGAQRAKAQDRRSQHCQTKLPHDPHNLSIRCVLFQDFHVPLTSDERTACAKSRMKAQDAKPQAVST
jgi:hypothetical protein